MTAAIGRRRPTAARRRSRTCPATTTAMVGTWGRAPRTRSSARPSSRSSSSTNTVWMDWWTVFYCRWWISWVSPFVGMFMAISRAAAPCASSSSAASSRAASSSRRSGARSSAAAFKMDEPRRAHASARSPTGSTGSVECLRDYDWDGNAVSDAAVPTPTAATTARVPPFITQIYDVGRPRDHVDCTSPHTPSPRLPPSTGDRPRALPPRCGSAVGLLFYFITACDSGSFVDDKLAAPGLRTRR